MLVKHIAELHAVASSFSAHAETYLRNHITEARPEVRVSYLDLSDSATALGIAALRHARNLQTVIEWKREHPG